MGEKLRELLERVRAATGPDNVLDFEIHREAGYPALIGVPFMPPGNTPFYTGDLNAITALIERELPGWSYILDTRPFLGGPSVRMLQPRQISTADDSAHGATPALALCAAFLSARIALHQGSGEP